MLKPGTIITDIEGHDLGDKGAVVVSVDGDVVKLIRIDTETPLTIRLDDAAYSAEEPAEGEDPGQWGYDESAMESPELHTIRWLPTYWGPRDPNNPSSLTDVMYRPEPYWRRQVHRHYDDRGDVRMTYHKTPIRRRAEQKPNEDISSSFVSEIIDSILVGIPKKYAKQADKKTGSMERNPGSWGSLSAEDWNVGVFYYTDDDTCEIAATVFDPQEDYMTKEWSFYGSESTTNEMGVVVAKWLRSALIGLLDHRRASTNGRLQRRTATTLGDVFNEMHAFNNLVAYGSESSAWQDFVESTHRELGLDVWDAEDQAQSVPDEWAEYWLDVADGQGYDYNEQGDARWASTKPQRRHAEPVYSMDPVPVRQPQGQQLQTDYGLPRRMRLDRWTEEKDHALDTEALVAHTIDFWQQYRAKRMSYMSEMGDHRSMNLKDWGLIYQHRAGLERPEIELLYRFMAAVDLIPQNEVLQFQDVLDSYSVFRYDRTDQ